MWFKLRYTVRRGRSAVPDTLRRIRLWRRVRPSSLALPFMAPWLRSGRSPCGGLRRLPAGGLARLAADVLARVLDSLPLVRLGRTVAADVRGDLPDQPLVEAGHVELGRALDRDRDSRRRLELDRVAEADLQRQLLPGHLRAVARTRDLERLGKALRDAVDHVGQDRPRRAVHGQRLLPAAHLRDDDLLGLHRHLDAVAQKRKRHLALRALDLDGPSVPRHGDAGRDRDRFLSYARRHGRLPFTRLCRGT